MFRGGSLQLLISELRLSLYALCKNSTLVEVFSILVFFSDCCSKLTPSMELLEDTISFLYIVTTLSLDETLCHIFCCAVFFFPNVPSSYEATGIVYSLPYFYFLQVFCCALLLKASVTVASHKKKLCVYIVLSCFFLYSSI